jgi:hypothetical protein
MRATSALIQPAVYTSTRRGAQCLQTPSSSCGALLTHPCSLSLSLSLCLRKRGGATLKGRPRYYVRDCTPCALLLPVTHLHATLALRLNPRRSRHRSPSALRTTVHPLPSSSSAQSSAPPTASLQAAARVGRTFLLSDTPFQQALNLPAASVGDRLVPRTPRLHLPLAVLHRPALLRRLHLSATSSPWGGGLGVCPTPGKDPSGATPPGPPG